MTKTEFLIQFVPARPVGKRDRAQAVLDEIILAAVAEEREACEKIAKADGARSIHIVAAIRAR